MSTFAEVMKTEANKTVTENGAYAIKSTNNACLDLFGTIGALRNTDDDRITGLFAEAYKEDPLLAAKTVFYGRDIRGGLGERNTFRKLLSYMAEYYPEALEENMDLIGVYGRYDDMYTLIGTPLENDMWQAMKKQFEEDKKNLSEGNVISLLAKWIKTPDASSQNTRKLGILTAKKLGYSVYNFKRILKSMRKHLNIVERLMSAGEWDKIKYSNVPSRAMMIYRNSFNRHDSDRYKQFIQAALNGEETIHSDTMYPYDFMHQIRYDGYDKSLEAQWRQLPDYVEPGQNVVIVADVSGSMNDNDSRPMDIAVGLAIYFAERNTGAYHNMFMTFSEHPEFETIKGNTLQEKANNLKKSDWDMSTNLEAVFDKVLEVAVENKIDQSEMPASIIIISDMEINACTNKSNRTMTFYEDMKSRFAASGYQIPNIVFWNVNSRHDVFHADKDCPCVQLCSGQSTATFKHLIDNIGKTPVEMMLNVLNSDRYSAITIAA